MAKKKQYSKNLVQNYQNSPRIITMRGEYINQLKSLFETSNY